MVTNGLYILRTSNTSIVIMYSLNTVFIMTRYNDLLCDDKRFQKLPANLF